MMYNVFRAEFVRSVIDMKRYPFEFLSQFVLIVVVFYGMFLGGSYIDGGHVSSSRLDTVIIDYAMWILILDAVGSMGFQISNEAKNGTLEQVFLSPAGPLKVLLFRSMANTLALVILIGVSMTTIMALTQHFLPFRPTEVIPFLIAILTAMGFGYCISAAAMILKKTSSLFNLIQFLFLFVLAAPIANMHGLWKYLIVLIPTSPSEVALQSIINPDTVSFSLNDLLLMSVLNLLIWGTGGILLFRASFRHAMKIGSLGHY